MQHRKLFIPDGLSVNHPFFYIIHHPLSDKLYSGYCSCKSHCDSDKLMTYDGYKTSSKYVAEIIKNEGLNSFKVIRVRHFETREAACLYEYRFLTKVNAMRNKRFLNRTNGGKEFRHKGWSIEDRAIMSQNRKGKKRIGPKRKHRNKGRPLSETHKANMRKPKTAEARKNMGNPGRKHSDETKEKLRIIRLGSKHSEITKGKIRSHRHTEEQIKKQSESQKGKKWWNNKIISKFCKECPDGNEWSKGRIKLNPDQPLL